MANKRPLISSSGQLSEITSSDTLLANNASFIQAANGNDLLVGTRNTDASPSGNFLKYTNAAGSTTLLNVDISGSPHVSGTLYVGGTSSIQWGDGGGTSGATNGFLSMSSNGVFRFGDNTGGGSPRIILGSATSSFVSILRNGTAVDLKLGDNSGMANLNVGTVLSGTWNGSVIGSSYGGAGSVNGILKANGSGTVSAASSGTDFAPATSGSNLLVGNGSGGFTNVTGSSVSGADVTLSGVLTLSDSLDTTKKAAFDISSIATATTRTFTFPNASGTFVLTAATQTLTNKTLTNPIINVGSDASGDVYYRDGSGNFVRLAKGSNGDILQLVSGFPSWQTLATGSGTVNAGTTDQLAYYTSNAAVVSGLTLSSELSISSGTISIRAGSTSQTGILQLTDSTSSTSTTTAATPNSVKTAYDLANAALPKAGGTMTGKITTVTTSTSTANLLLAGAAADPSTPASGDFWNNSGTLKFYNGSATKTILFSDGTVANSTNVAITDDTSTNATYYPSFSPTTSGNNGLKVSSTKLTFNPSTGILTSAIYDKGGQVYNAKAYGVTGDGSTDDRTALNTLVNTTMSSGGRLLLPTGTYVVGSDMTIPANVSIDPSSNGVLSPSTGVTITILGHIPAEARQFFTGAGTIKGEGNYRIQSVFPEWFGASPSASGSTNTPAIAKAHIFAFGSNRKNGTDLQKYNRKLIFSGMYDINDTNVFYHNHGVVWEGLQKFGCGFKLVATNKIMFNFQSLTRAKFLNLKFETNSTQSADGICFLLLDYDSADHAELVTNPDLKVQDVRFYDCFFAGNGVANIGIWIGKTPGSQGDNVSFHNCYGQSFNYALGVIGGNNTSPLTDSGYNYNTLHVVWDGGDIQACKNGLISYGGNWVVRNVTVENQYKQTFGTGTTILEDGVDFYAEAAIRGMVLENVLSESYRIAAGDDITLKNVRQQGTATGWYIAGTHNLAGTTSFVGQMIMGTGVGGNGKMYEATSVGTYGGLTYTQATGGSTTTLVKTSAGWTTDAYQGMRVSILAGTGKYLYGIISSNTSDTLTVSSWLTKYEEITDTAPDSTSFFVIEPNWGTATSSGTVDFVERDFYAISGLANSSYATTANVVADGLYLTHQGKVRAKGSFKNVIATRTDWLSPHSNILDDTDIYTYWENVNVFEGAAGSTYKRLAWNAPRNRSGADTYSNQEQKGTSKLVWSAGQAGGGTSYQDLWLGRGDGIAYNNSNSTYRNVLAVQGTFGKKVAFGSNVAGLDFHLQSGLSTGNAAPGKIYILTGSSGSSGSSVNVSDTATDAYFDNKGLKLKSYTYANLPASSNGQILYCSDGTPSGTLAGSSTGCLVQRLNGAWLRVVNTEGGGGTTINSTDNVVPYRSNSTTFADSPLYVSGSLLGVSATSPAAKLHISGNISANSWTTNGIQTRHDAATFTNANSSGTVANIAVNAWAQPTLAASSSTTYTNASTLYIANSPTAGTNVTLTNSYALHVGAGNIAVNGIYYAIDSAVSMAMFSSSGDAGYVGTTSNTSLKLMTNNSAKWQIATGGALTATTNNSYDFGSGSNAARDIYAARNVLTVGANVGATATPNSTLQVTGSISTGFVTKTANYTATASDHKIYVDSTSNVVTITLPTAATCAGREYVIKDWKGTSESYAITIACSNSELIDGIATFTINTNYDSITVTSTGSGWGID